MSRFLQFFLKGAWPRAWLRLTLAAGAAIGVPFISVYPVLRKFLIKFSGPAHRSRLNALMDPVRPISLERCTLLYCTVLVTPHHHHYATLRLAPLRRIALLLHYYYPTLAEAALLLRPPRLAEAIIQWRPTTTLPTNYLRTYL